MDGAAPRSIRSLMFDGVVPSFVSESLRLARAVAMRGETIARLSVFRLYGVVRLGIFRLDGVVRLH